MVRLWGDALEHDPPRSSSDEAFDPPVEGRHEWSGAANKLGCVAIVGVEGQNRTCQAEVSVDHVQRAKLQGVGTGVISRLRLAWLVILPAGCPSSTISYGQAASTRRDERES